jgi:hypothetical protein
MTETLPFIPEMPTTGEAYDPCAQAEIDRQFQDIVGAAMLSETVVDTQSVDAAASEAKPFGTDLMQTEAFEGLGASVAGSVRSTGTRPYATTTTERPGGRPKPDQFDYSDQSSTND